MNEKMLVGQKVNSNRLNNNSFEFKNVKSVHLKILAKCHFCRTLFPNCKAVSQRQEGIKKTYVINPGYFEFGHLLCGKTRDR